MGIALEALHALKVPLYLDARNDTRRLMWTLAHAHGTLLSLIQIALACTMTAVRFERARGGTLMALAQWLMPLGFTLGGVWTYGGDPGPGVALVAAGGVLLLIGTGMFVLSLARKH
jgi:hypothetical protein